MLRVVVLLPLLALWHPQSSAIGGFLCLGFLRKSLGGMGRDALTGPTRSRAMERTSLGWSNLGPAEGAETVGFVSWDLRFMLI